MNSFVDAAAILLLLVVALGLPGLGLPCPGTGPPVGGAALAVVPAACWIAVVTPALVRSDLARRRLPNALTLPAVGLAVAGAAGAAVSGGGGRDPALAAGVVAVTLFVGVLGARRAGVGLGDVKLGAALAGSAALVGPEALAVFSVGTGLCGLAAAVVALRRAGSRGTRTTIAYGPCLLSGYWAALTAAGVASWLPSGGGT
ncbi:prepilin peptidase [Frondihabitans peucedani]|uniref:Prepilin type IV endopeptidase peptidase domain-containing protein n=1 Tax=Frondihabitans peucedani TaxID=598626 RepID=A0ABP8E6F5_9MICO